MSYLTAYLEANKIVSDDTIYLGATGSGEGDFDKLEDAVLASGRVIIALPGTHVIDNATIPIKLGAKSFISQGGPKATTLTMTTNTHSALEVDQRANVNGFSVSGVILNSKGFIVVTAGSGTDSIVLSDLNASGGATLIELLGGQLITIRNINYRFGGIGIVVGDATDNPNGVIIENSLFSLTNTGVKAVKSTAGIIGIDVKNCTFEFFGTNGITSDANYVGFVSTVGCKFQNLSAGMDMDGGAVVSSTSDEFANNTNDFNITASATTLFINGTKTTRTKISTAGGGKFGFYIDTVDMKAKTFADLLGYEKYPIFEYGLMGS